MTLSYRPGDTLAHRLDPRTKLAVQAGFAVAAFAHTSPRGLVALTAVVGGILVVARTGPLAALGEFRAVLPFLVGAPVVAAIRLGPPWVDPAAAVDPALAAYRAVLLLLVSAAYVRTTPARESRAAVQRVVPGRPGVMLGAGVGFLLRFFPLLQRDLLTVRDAQNARLGTERSLVDRVHLAGVGGLRRLFLRADRFDAALRARCFAWNPTLPALRFGRLDAPALVAAAALAGSALP